MKAQSICENRGKMQEWDGLHRGGQLWGCLQTAELSSRKQLYLRLQMPCLLMAEWVKEKPEVNPLAALLPYISPAPSLL